MHQTCLKIFLSIALALLSAQALAQGIPADLASSVNGFGEESPAAAAFLEKSVRKGASRDFTEKVLKEAKSLREKGMPAEPYLLKASEGLAKGAPPERIGGALQKTRRQTEEAESFVNRTLERKGLSSTPEEKRGAISNFQKALFLNQTPPRRLEKWIDTEEGPGKSKSSLDQLGKGARELSKNKRETSILDSESRTPSQEPNVLKPRNSKEADKKTDWKKHEEKSKPQGGKTERGYQEDSRGKEKGYDSFLKPRESSFERPAPSSPSSGRGHGKNK